jgi:flagellar M-ring protein FliF
MSELYKFLSELSRMARLSLGFAFVLMAGIGTWVLWQLWHPQLEALQTQMESNEVTKLASELDAAKIQFEIGADGKSILVPQAELVHARQKMAMSGMAGGGRVGFEAFDEASLGTTDFAQRINFQRALQGELERTIESVLATHGVRVHLSLPTNRGLLQEKRVAKASVFVALERLEPTQVLAVQRIVTGAVDGMTLSQVSVISGNGKQLDSPQSKDAVSSGMPLGGMQVAQEEKRIEERVRGLLQRFVPTQQIGIAASIEMNFDRVERSEQITGNAELARELMQRDGLNYVGEAKASTTEARKIAPGVLKRMSIAVLLPKNSALPSDEVLRRIISAGVGLNMSRGDALEVSYLTTAIVAENHDAQIQSTQAMIHGDADESLPHTTQTAAGLLAVKLPFGAVWLGVSGALLILGVAGALSFRAGRRAQIPYDRSVALARLQTWLGENELSGP